MLHIFSMLIYRRQDNIVTSLEILRRVKVINGCLGYLFSWKRHTMIWSNQAIRALQWTI